MAVDIIATPFPDGYYCKVQLTGLTVGTRYDVMRWTQRYTGDDDLGNATYSQPLPDRRSNWSVVAHRQGWEAIATTRSFRDFDAPLRPYLYFVVETTKVGPTDFDFDQGDYPLSRGVLDDVVVHMNRTLSRYKKGRVLIRSTRDPGFFAEACIHDMPTLRYTARGTELPVIGRQYPVYVSDTREARRGTIVLTTPTLGDYDDLRRIVFPANGRISPIIFDTYGGEALLVDDMTAIPLDVTIEPATPNNADLRFITIDYVESDPTRPRDQRTGDNDDLTNAPEANFTINPNNPREGEWVTVTDTSTGQITRWDWAWGNSSDNKFDRNVGPGPFRRRWAHRGEHEIKLRVIPPDGLGLSVDVRKKTITVRK